jgi:hypothetical protein
MKIFLKNSAGIILVIIISIYFCVVFIFTGYYLFKIYTDPLFNIMSLKLHGILSIFIFPAWYIAIIVNFLFGFAIVIGLTIITITIFIFGTTKLIELIAPDFYKKYFTNNRKYDYL